MNIRSRAYREAMHIILNGDRDNPLWGMAILLVSGMSLAREVR